MSYRRSLYWMRRDLRVLDNPALFYACEQSEQVIALYITTPQQWQQHHLSYRQSDLIQRQLKALQQELATLGIPLLVIDGEDFNSQPKQLQQLIEQLGVEALYANLELEWNESQRDNLLQQTLSIPNFWYHERTLLEPSSLRNGSGKPYQVFTPFGKACRQRLIEQGVHCLPKPKTRLSSPDLSEIREGLRHWPYPTEESQRFQVGTEAILTQMRRFVIEQAEQYKEQRDFPALAGTSVLSPYLAIGALSTRQCIARICYEYGALEQLPEGVDCWLNELLWREFYQHVMVHWPHVMKGQCFKADYEALPWHNDQALFRAWCEGKTGFPIVDAAMRQLNETGWMHNRLRMITASFLCKDLLIDWRWGERYFMSKLVDGDLAANNGGWQWAASTGTDAAPYFRVFNPLTQSKRFDPDGDFIRSYCYELENCSNKQLHQQGDGVSYHKAIVEHSVQRTKAIDLYTRATSRSLVSESPESMKARHFVKRM